MTGALRYKLDLQMFAGFNSKTILIFDDGVEKLICYGDEILSSGSEIDSALVESPGVDIVLKEGYKVFSITSSEPTMTIDFDGSTHFDAYSSDFPGGTDQTITITTTNNPTLERIPEEWKTSFYDVTYNFEIRNMEIDEATSLQIATVYASFIAIKDSRSEISLTAFSVKDKHSQEKITYAYDIDTPTRTFKIQVPPLADGEYFYLVYSEYMGKKYVSDIYDNNGKIVYKPENAVGGGR